MYFFSLLLLPLYREISSIFYIIFIFYIIELIRNDLSFSDDSNFNYRYRSKASFRRELNQLEFVILCIHFFPSYLKYTYLLSSFVVVVILKKSCNCNWIYYFLASFLLGVIFKSWLFVNICNFVILFNSNSFSMNLSFKIDFKHKSESLFE